MKEHNDRAFGIRRKDHSATLKEVFGDNSTGTGYSQDVQISMPRPEYAYDYDFDGIKRNQYAYDPFEDKLVRIIDDDYTKGKYLSAKDHHHYSTIANEKEKERDSLYRKRKITDESKDNYGEVVDYLEDRTLNTHRDYTNAKKHNRYNDIGKDEEEKHKYSNYDELNRLWNI